jgi:hypothetical protein
MVYRPPLAAAGLMLPDACAGNDFTRQDRGLLLLPFD